MSVALFASDELAVFVAMAVRTQQLDFNAALDLAAVIAAGNCAAYNAQYEEAEAPVNVADIERDALHYLAQPHLLMSAHIRALAYNMITNDGTAYSAPGCEIAQDADIIEYITSIEKVCAKWFQAEKRRIIRQRRDDEAFAEVSPLPLITKHEIAARCQSVGCKRVIVAEFRVDESDMMTDYHGGRTVRRVVIGFGKGKRENFKQLHKAAALFPPTKEFGPDSLFEHRECWSMGGGNYLGHSRYGGWQVRSHLPEYFHDSTKWEFFKPVAANATQKHLTALR